MQFRATAFAIESQAIKYSARHSADILKFQKQISSGVRFDRPSDDPIQFRQATALTSRFEELDTELYALDSAEIVLNFSVAQLTDANRLLVAAKSLAQQGIQATDQSERDSLATEAEGILEQLKDFSLSQYDGSYIYGGTRTDVPPFEFAKPAYPGGTMSVDYLGAEKSSQVYIGQSITVESYANGDEIFSNYSRGETIKFGNITGAKLGVGTDTLIGRATFSVTHTNTSFAGGSGVAAGTDSAAMDTIIGAMGDHTLQIVDTAGDGSAGTVSLNGGTPVAFTNAMNNLEVTALNGETIFLDTTTIAPGFNGSVDVLAQGEMSIDGGATQTPIDFSAQQIVSDPTGKFVVMDSSDIRRTGTEHLEFPGTSDAFQVLHELIADFRNTRGLDNKSLKTAFDNRIGELEESSDRFLNSVGRQATSLKTLDRLRFRMQDLKLQVENQLSDIKATNIPETVLRMENSENLLQFTYAVTSRISNLGIIDFLR